LDKVGDKVGDRLVVGIEPAHIVGLAHIVEEAVKRVRFEERQKK
jgi:hypothetical protein